MIFMKYISTLEIPWWHLVTIFLKRIYHFFTVHTPVFFNIISDPPRGLLLHELGESLNILDKRQQSRSDYCFCLLIFTTRIRNKKVKKNIIISCFLIKNQFMKGCTGHGNQLVFLICNRKEKSALHPWWLSHLMVSLETLSMHHFICKLYLRLICAVQKIMKNHQHICMIKWAEWNGCLKSKSKISYFPARLPSQRKIQQSRPSRME